MDYTTHLNTIIRYAREEAERLGTAQVMPDHLVLAILRVDDSKASQLLLQSGVDFADLKHDLDNHLFVSTYKLQLPDESTLEEFLIRQTKDYE